jgi:hypothetical protein
LRQEALAFAAVAEASSGAADRRVLRRLLPRPPFTPLPRKEGCVGAVAFSRTGDPSVGEFGDATVIRSFGDLTGDLSSL